MDVQISAPLAAPPPPVELRFARGPELAALIPPFVAGLSDFALRQRFAAHLERSDVERRLLQLLDSPKPSASFMALDASGAGVAHLHAGHLGTAGHTGLPVLEIARVVRHVGMGHGTQLLAHARRALGAALLCASSNLANVRLLALARASFPLVYSTRLSGLLHLPAKLLLARPPGERRDADRLRRLLDAQLPLQLPCHVAVDCPWQPIEAAELRQLWQHGGGDWRRVEERLLTRAGVRFRQLAMPHTAKVLGEAYRTVYGRELAPPRFREQALVQRQRIVAALRRDGMLS